MQAVLGNRNFKVKPWYLPFDWCFCRVRTGIMGDLKVRIVKNSVVKNIYGLPVEVLDGIVVGVSKEFIYNTRRRKMAEPTRTQINEYVKTLDDVVQKLYNQTEIAYFLTLHDTLSDEFQIVANILDVFSAQTETHLHTYTE